MKNLYLFLFIGFVTIAGLPILLMYLSFSSNNHRALIFFGGSMLIPVLYYLYANFMKRKKDETPPLSEMKVTPTQNKREDFGENSPIKLFSSDSPELLRIKQAESIGVKRAALVGTIIFLIANFFVIVLGSTSKPGEGMTGLLFAPFIWVMWMFCLVYFAILAMRYSREKSAMHYLDKIEFFILALYFLIFFSFTLINNV